MSFPKDLKLRAWGPLISGAGDELTLTFEAYRKGKRPGVWTWRGKIIFDVERHLILKLAEQIRDMQARDLERLAHERDRIRKEIQPLFGASPKETNT